MNLFINAISTKGILILFNNNRQIVDKMELKILGNESSKLTFFINDFLQKNKLNYSDLENIIAASGPGSFTGVRIISLIVNTIAFTNKNLNITAINFFSMFSLYPIIKSSSKRDLFVKKTKNSKIEIIKNDNFINYLEEKQIKDIYGDLNNNLLKEEIEIEIKTDIDYKKLLKNILFDSKKTISPIYIKKPNIN